MSPHRLSSSACNTFAMPTMKQMLEAHVQFETARWQGDALQETISEEVHAAFEWLQRVPLQDLVPLETALAVSRDAVRAADITDTAIRLCADAVRAAHQAALRDDSLLGDVLDVNAYDKASLAAIRLKDLRGAIIEQTTTSEVYSQLMSHVMYQGIKNYLQTENVIAKKVPGASTLMKVGSTAISTAAPKLEKAIDKQLTAFVNANISDTIRDSRQFLDKVLDEKLLKAVTDELWEANVKVQIKEYAALVPVGATDTFIEVGRELWDHLRSLDVFDHYLVAVVTDFYKHNGKKKVGSLLADVSVTPEVVIDLTDTVTPVIEKAVADGFVESRIRAHLAAFYETYEG